MRISDLFEETISDEAFQELVEKAASSPLGMTDAARAMAAMAEGRPSPFQIASLLTAKTMEIEEVEPETVAGLVGEVRSRALVVDPSVPNDRLLDTCGTGGGAPTMNVSTAAAIVAASTGFFMAKHGNRAVGSRCGSADILEALGIEIDLSPEEVERSLEERGFAFIFAPRFHRAFAHVMPVRKVLGGCGIRTVFNIVGPLANPAPVRRQLVGVFSPAIVGKIASVLLHLGTDRAVVCSGETEDGRPMDEVSISGPTHFALLESGTISEGTWLPEEIGVTRGPIDEIGVSSVGEALERFMGVMEGGDGPGIEITAANAGAAIFAGGGASSVREGVSIARERIISGGALATLEGLKGDRAKIPE